MTGAGTNRNAELLTGGPAIILVEPQLGENIGMAARAMANFGLSNLRLVRPRERWLHAKTRAASAGAVFVLEQATIFPDLRSAIADLSFVYATTARERGQGKIVVGPDEAGPVLRAREAAGERAGIVFGRERTGLENEDLALTDQILTFPVNPAYASLNLSQAVLLVGYAWMAAGERPLPFTYAPRWPAAPREMLLSFFDYLESELDSRDFFRPPEKKPLMIRNLRNMFHRMGMTEQDVRTFRGLVVRLVEGQRITKPRPRKGPHQTPKGTRPGASAVVPETDPDPSATA